MENITEVPPSSLTGGDRKEDLDQMNKCFICWRGTKEDGLKLEHLFRLKKGYQLSSSLSVVFLLRKVLGLPQHVLISLLGENCGRGDDGGDVGGDNPAEWGIKLCGSCGVIFKEAHFLYRRLIKIQADYQEVTKELRNILIESSPSLAEEEIHLQKGKRRRRLGRPSSKKITGNVEPVKMEMEETGSASTHPVRFLRTKFLECNKANTLRISPPKLLFTLKTTQGTTTTTTTGSEPPFLNGIQTTSPVNLTVKVTTENFLQANGVPTVSIPPLTVTSPSNPAISSRSPPNHIQAPPKVTSQEATSTLLIKQEHNQLIYQEPLDTLHDICDDYNDNLMMSPLPPPPPEEEPEDYNDLNEGDNFSTDSQEDPTNDSDFNPSPSPKKRDKLFTRKKPNLKENQRRKNLRSVKALSLSKAPTVPSSSSSTSAIPEPLKITEERDHTIYKCPQDNCSQTFPKKFECHVHLLRDHFEDPMPYHCHVCSGKRFLKEAYFRKHMVRYHLSARSPYDSDYSPSLHSASHLKSLISQDSLPAHDSSDSDDPSKIPGIPQIPPEILQKFTSISEGSPFTCPHCPRKFSNEMLRDGHLKLVHLNIPKPFTCHLCPLAFLRRTRLLQHLTITHFSNLHSCPQCGARFADKVLLSGHIGRAHLGIQKPFNCPHCPATFLRRTKMDLHQFKKHQVPLPQGPSKRKIPARCIPLPKLHPQKTKKGDSPSIGPPPPKKCWICYSPSNRLPTLFDTTEDLKDHNDLYHKISPDTPRPFKCPVPKCPREYRTHATLDFHMMNIHNGCIEENYEGTFKCTRCTESYPRGDLLDQHMATIHKISLFICNYCAKQFRTSKYLEDHQKQSHYKELNIEPPFKCKFCGKIMNTAKSLDHHVKMVHLKDT